MVKTHTKSSNLSCALYGYVAMWLLLLLFCYFSFFPLLLVRSSIVRINGFNGIYFLYWLQFFSSLAFSYWTFFFKWFVVVVVFFGRCVYLFCLTLVLRLFFLVDFSMERFSSCEFDVNNKKKLYITYLFS